MYLYHFFLQIMKRQDLVKNRGINEIVVRNTDNQLKNTPKPLSNNVSTHVSQKISSECYENSLQSMFVPYNCF
jgi:hypothetical protein